ncbi:transporter substrate-binding domain-containing protein [Fluviispira vulneris]|uniref:transporter substrate-binding domain-containing protein n=1 Tax=Fluviispira vulneris TaxID=2763012 RepID=UPI001648B901|nr:transporter substrate-binding domain-containing protein [Fluviispira vulneris]
MIQRAILLALAIFSSYKSMAAENLITLHYQDRPPYFVTDNVTKQLKGGELYLLIKKIMKEANIPYEFQIEPISRSILAIKNNNEPVCITYAYITTEREQFSYFSKPYYTDEIIALAIRKEDKRFDKYKTLEEIMKDDSLMPLAKIGYSWGNYTNKLLAQYKNYISTEIDKIDPKKIKVTSQEPKEMLQTVANNGADYTYFSINEIQYHLNQNKELKDKLKLKKLNDMKEAQSRYFMCAKIVGEKTMEKINKAIKKVTHK